MKKITLLIGAMCFGIISTFAQGETCATAITITGTGLISTDGPATGGGAVSNGTNADWFAFTAPAGGGTIDISACGLTTEDTRLFLHDGTCAVLNAVNNDDDFCGLQSELLGTAVTGGVTYYIEWTDIYDNGAFDFNFTFTPPPVPADVGVISVESTTGCSLGMETVTVKVKNFGTAPQTGFDVAYSLNGTPVTPETTTGMLMPGDTLTHVFTSMANMVTPGVYTFNAWTLLAGDGYNPNDSAIGSTAEHITPALNYNGAAPISDNITNGTSTSLCTSGLVSNMLDTCFQLSALVIDSLEHTFVGDLEIWLISPVNDSLLISFENGGGSNDIIGTIFTDTAATNISGNDPSVSGFYHSEELIGLAKFNGTNPSGQWTLYISDNAGGDDGTIYDWHLEFTDNSFVVNLGTDSNACSVDTLMLDAGAGNYSYSWSTGETTQTINADTTSLSGNGSYNLSVTVTDTITGCAVTDTVVVNFSSCVGIYSPSENINLTVYPNPNNGVFTLNVSTTNVKELEVKVMNIQGQIVFAKNNFDNISNVKEQIDLSNNANGIYFITVTSDKGVKTHKVIVQ